jgi:DNA-binding NarL/FixJ family response regulator
MKPTLNPTPEIQSVLILKADRVYGEALRALVARVLPQAHIRLEHTLNGATSSLAASPAELLITGLGAALGGDVIDFLSSQLRSTNRVRRVLVVTTHHEPRLLAALRSLGVHGMFDSASENSERLAEAVRIVACGQYFWSQAILDRIRADVASGRSHARLLTPCEQLVLSVIGGGCDNVTAARELSMTPGTISSVRRDLHRKLGAQHRGELMCIAAQSGFVQFTPHGVLRPGFSLLTAAHRGRKTKSA